MSPSETLLAGVKHHPHARAILHGALKPGNAPSHAYLFYGPLGTGKRAVARAFASALLLEGAAQPHTVAERVARDAHPDLTWVRPSGASELLVSDIERAVVAAVGHTPFESARRVFVIESAGTMNDQSANKLLKTLEEPPSFAHLILLAEHRDELLATIASRCQLVRFDPLSSELLQQRLTSAPEPLPLERAEACARLARGDGRLATLLASEQGGSLRECAERFARAALHRDVQGRSWLGVLELASSAATHATEAIREQLHEQAQLLPGKEQRKHEREGADAVRRAERRARTTTLDLALRLVELWLRDAWCIACGAEQLVFARDRLLELSEDAAGASPETLLRGIELVGDTRLRLALNVSEELALESLAYRLVDLPFASAA